MLVHNVCKPIYVNPSYNLFNRSNDCREIALNSLSDRSGYLKIFTYLRLDQPQLRTKLEYYFI